MWNGHQCAFAAERDDYGRCARVTLDLGHVIPSLNIGVLPLRFSLRHVGTIDRSYVGWMSLVQTTSMLCSSS